MAECLSGTAESEAERLEAALEMWEDGVSIMRENLRRQSADATDEEIEVALDTWLTTRPGAELGDAEGLAVAWPRPKR